MKLSLKKPKNLKRRHLFGLGGFIVLAGTSIAGILLMPGIARSEFASDDKFNLVMPYFGGSTQGTDVYLEISQPGENNTLDAPEAWAKVYIDENRINDTNIGIFRGGYANGVDSQGHKYQGQNGSFADDDSTNFEFMYGIELPNGSFTDEIPCPTPFATKNSGDMSSTGWYKLEMSRFNGGSCGSKKWDASDKSGKYVVFVKASWRVKPNPISDGRLNAFKIGAAYVDSKGSLDNPLTGYWSNYQTAIDGGTPRTAAYSVQDRKSPDGTQGDYTFKFAPDCRIPYGKEDAQQRYLHWKDVDYPDYYGGQAAPEFDVIEISPSGNRTRVVHVDKDTRINGSSPFGQNKHAAIPFKGKGGYKYEWIWKNITRVDGISFWLPYDDYPSLTSCGNYQQKIGIWMNPGNGWTQAGTLASPVEIAGGSKLQFFLDEGFTGSGVASTTVTNAYLTSAPNSPYANTFNDVSGAVNISDSGTRQGRAQVQWTLPGMTTKKSQRWLLYEYNVKANAQDGAIHCFNGDLTPLSSAEPLKQAKSNTICIKINNSLKPYLSTSGGDVHAGDCIITTQGNGKITGPPVNNLNIGSSGSYIVSAGDRITDFGSGGSPKDSPLSFGKTGYYGSVCRPRISESDVDKAVADGAVNVPFSGTNLNLATELNSKPDNKKYVIKVPHGTTISGTSTRSATIYGAGDVTITGNVGGDMGTKYAKDKLPVVGIFTEGDISINPGVTKIDALLYSYGNVDTCNGQDIKTAGGVAACKPALTLNGFAMAKSFSFKRTTGSAGLTKAEDLIFNAAFYLNPPPVFGKAAGAVKYLGERAPLY